MTKWQVFPYRQLPIEKRYKNNALIERWRIGEGFLDLGAVVLQRSQAFLSKVSKFDRKWCCVSATQSRARRL